MYPTKTSAKLVRDLRTESRTLGNAWMALQDEVEQLERHKTLLKQEWRDLEMEKERLERENQRFEKIVAQEWFPVSVSSPRMADRVVRLNVGGQIFEITAQLLAKDRFSLLAAVCLPEEESILRPGPDGYFFFDRDWFLFKYILMYLRNNSLPRDKHRLRELYHEAGFYCLGSMQRDIQILLSEIQRNVTPQIVRPKTTVTGVKPKAVPATTSATTQPRVTAARNLSYEPTNGELPDPFGFTSKSQKL